MLRFSYDLNGQRQAKIERSYGNVVHTTKYFYDGTKLAGEKKDDTIVWYDYDENGAPVGMRVNGLDYIFRKNLQGDITGIYNSSAELIVEYTYSDAWGAGVTVSGSAASTIGMYNSFRYRGYYYDTESGLYYLNSRYYDPVACRFINADSQLNPVEGNFGHNLYSYCGNNPVNRIDPTGDAWWHWALGAVIVAGCAIATVATAGGFLAAVGAVGAVGSGMAAATTGATIAAGAFIGSAVVYGAAVCSAAESSRSLKEFNSKGNWGTVAATAGGAVAGGGSAYVSSKYPSKPIKSFRSYSRGSTGRTEPNNLLEQLFMEKVKADPYSGYKIHDLILNDSRWSSADGWVKMQQTVETSKGRITIHYVYNEVLDIFDDFKFK